MSQTRVGRHGPPGATTTVTSSSTGANAHGIRGTVRIAPSVLIELIELTVTTIPGVAGLRSRPRRPQEGTIDLGVCAGRRYENGKVLVRVDGDQIGADVGLAMYRGTNVTELSAGIQRKVGLVVGNMLGMTVQTVNVFIEDIVPPPNVTP